MNATLLEPITPKVPELEPGDHLSWFEFERRYATMPEVKKAELIRGIVFKPSPVRFDQHSKQDAVIISWLQHYQAFTPGTETGNNPTVRLDDTNAPQPDSILIIDSTCGGQCKIDKKGYIVGAPELIVEIASSSVSFDLGTKKDVYLECGVQEYLVWRVLDNEVDWFLNHKGEFIPFTADPSGILKSRCFPGLRLSVPALLQGDARTLLSILDQGLNSKEHAEFVELLASRKRSASP